MRTEEVVSLLRGKGRYPRWRARCPVHKSKGLTLAIKAGPDRTHITCHAGCHSDEVLAAIGLKWTDTLYNQNADPKELREQHLRLLAEERKASQLRIGAWILRFIGQGYTREDAAEDQAILCACVVVLTNQTNRAWESILRVTTERMAAAQHCIERRMLPEIAAPRKDFP